MSPEDFKSFSEQELAAKLSIPIEKLQLLKKTLKNNDQHLQTILNNYQPLTDDSITNQEVAEVMGRPKSIVDKYRSILIQHDLIKSKRAGRSLGSIKKLCRAYHHDGRSINLNRNEMAAAGLDPKNDYYLVIEPKDRRFEILTFNSPKEARDYQKKKS